MESVETAEQEGLLKFGSSQVGLEPTTLRLTVAAASITAGCCDCLWSAEVPYLQGSGQYRRLLPFTTLFYVGSFAFPFDLANLCYHPLFPVGIRLITTLCHGFQVRGWGSAYRSAST